MSSTSPTIVSSIRCASNHWSSAKPARAGWRLPLDRLQQLPAEREDLVGIAENRLALGGELQLAALPLEEGLPKRTVERTELGAERRLGDVQRGGGLRHATVLGDRPETVQK